MAFRESDLASYATKLQQLVRRSENGVSSTVLLSSMDFDTTNHPQLRILQAGLAQLLQMFPCLISQLQSLCSSQAELLQRLPCSSPVQSSILLPESAQAASPQIQSQSLQVQSLQVSSHLSHVESSKPHISTVQLCPRHVQLPGALRLVTTAIINLKGHSGCTQKEIIAYIFANCDACKDSRVYKRALIKGIKRGVVTRHLHHDGLYGFKLAKHSHWHLKYHPSCRRHINLKFHQSHTWHHTHTHHKTHTCHQSNHLKCYLAHGQHKRHLVHDHHRHFKRNCSTIRSIESYSNLGMIVNTPATASGGDVTASPIPFLTPSADDVNPPVYTLHEIHSAIETPHESHAITDSLSPFPTPRKEDDFLSPRKLHQMYPRKKELKVAEDIPKVFFITAVGNCDSNTISSVGRYLLGVVLF